MCLDLTFQKLNYGSAKKKKKISRTLLDSNSYLYLWKLNLLRVEIFAYFRKLILEACKVSILSKTKFQKLIIFPMSLNLLIKFRNCYKILFTLKT